jgi:hypothetical protein
MVCRRRRIARAIQPPSAAEDAMATTVIKVPAVGEPERPPLSDGKLQMIVDGLTIPSQGAAKAMARELITRRKEPPSGK